MSLKLGCGCGMSLSRRMVRLLTQVWLSSV
jgi:hypothetical protein